jgi:hypothetical protein
VLRDAAKLMVVDRGNKIRPQTKVTAQWPEGSIKFVHLSFLADLPGAGPKKYFLSTDGGTPGKILPEVTAD